MTDQCNSGKDIGPRCPKPARAAVKVTNGTKLTSTVYFDDREAPPNAIRYCKAHAAVVVRDLVNTLTENDD